jgi:hypothetical protein
MQVVDLHLSVKGLPVDPVFRRELEIDVDDIDKAGPPVREIGVRRIRLGAYGILDLSARSSLNSHPELAGQDRHVEVVPPTKDPKISPAAPYLVVLQAGGSVRLDVNGRLPPDTSALVGFLS